MRSVYDEVYGRWQRDPEGFWAAAAEDLHWDRRWDRVFDDSRPPYYRWFAGGMLNTCYNALDLHVDRGPGQAGGADLRQPGHRHGADLHLSSSSAMRSRASPARLRGQGVAKGDRVIIYMPMVPEAVVAMLACARIGAIHSVVFGGFAPKELATRIDDAKPTRDPLRLLRHRGQSRHPLQAAARRRHRDGEPQAAALHHPPAAAGAVRARAPAATWTGARRWRAPRRWTACRWRPPTRSTSSTPRAPPASPRAWCATTAAMPSRSSGPWSNVYGMGAGETYWAASDIGWVVGHSYIVYAPLLRGCTTILYEGKPVGTPDPGAFWRVASQHGVSALFTAPTAFRAIKKEDPQGSLHREVRSLALPHPLPRRRALRPGHAALGARAAPGAGDRPLVADGDGLAHGRQLRGARHAAGEAGLAHQGGAGL